MVSMVMIVMVIVVIVVIVIMVMGRPVSVEVNLASLVGYVLLDLIHILVEPRCESLQGSQ